MDYKNAGVDIEAGYKSVELMKQHVQETMRKEVLSGLGGFSGSRERMIESAPSSSKMLAPSRDAMLFGIKTRSREPALIERAAKAAESSATAAFAGALILTPRRPSARPAAKPSALRANAVKHKSRNIPDTTCSGFPARGHCSILWTVFGFGSKQWKDGY